MEKKKRGNKYDEKFMKMTREDANAIWGQHTPTKEQIKKKKAEAKKKK